MKRLFAALGIAATMSQSAWADMDGFEVMRAGNKVIGAQRNIRFGQPSFNNYGKAELAMIEHFNFQTGTVCVKGGYGIHCVAAGNLSPEGVQYFDSIKKHFIPN